MKLRPLILSICLFVAGVAHAEKGDFMRFFYRVGVWLDGYSLRGLDTTYIGLPEHTWRLALTNSEVGIHSTYEINNPNWLGGGVVLKSNTKPSIDLGFQVGLRAFGFGYSWDALHAYAQKLNLSMGGKAWGVELQRQTSGNIKSTIFFPGYASYGEFELPENCVLITNTNLTAWYALNSAHYSHNAAVKQAYIQKRTAGSLLLNLSYMNTDIAFDKELDTIRLLPMLLNGTSNIVTHQVAVGVGYGINYTPNNGKVLISDGASGVLLHQLYLLRCIGFPARICLPELHHQTDDPGAYNRYDACSSELGDQQVGASVGACASE